MPVAPLRRVLLTGAAGAIGTAVGERVPSGWKLVRTDLRSGPGVAALDVTDAAACATAFAGADAVVHLAGDPRPDASWEDLLGPNVVGTVTVARAAAAAGVGRLVLASSNQALSAHPPERQLRAADPPRPANLYGATKAWAEAVGCVVAASSSTTVVAIRIGHFAATPPLDDARDRAAWLSPGDAAELVRAAVEGPVPEGFTVVNGISANRYRFAELGRAEAAIGYRPRDDAFTGVSGADPMGM